MAILGSKTPSLVDDGHISLSSDNTGVSHGAFQGPFKTKAILLFIYSSNSQCLY